MNTENLALPLKYKIRYPLKEVSNTPTIFFLHGFGSNMDDLFSLNQFFPDDWMIISLQAPIPQGFGGWAWAELDFSNLKKLPKPKQRFSSREMIITSIKAIKEKYNINSKNTYLLGFSQGASFSLFCGLTNPHEFNGLVAICGFYEASKDTSDLDAESIKNLEIFVSNGTIDETIPIHMGRMTDRGLRKLGLRHTYNEYDTGHTISNNCLNDILNWLQIRHQR